MARNQRASIAAETLKILEEGVYVSPDGRRVRLPEDWPAAALEDSRLWRPDDLEVLYAQRSAGSSRDRTGSVAVVNQTVLEAMSEVVAESEGPIGCLNFASAKNPGGGFLKGAHAQEESLARSSGLYLTLTHHMEYYKANRQCKTPLYTDHIIVSPRVPVIRNDAGALLERPYFVTMITSPAPNAGVAAPEILKDVGETLFRRAGYVLAVAEESGVRDLVLGAWGCGVFRNDPDMVASVFAKLLLDDGPFEQAFDRVIFAVLDRSPNRSTIGPFLRCLGDGQQAEV